MINDPNQMENPAENEGNGLNHDPEIRHEHHHRGSHRRKRRSLGYLIKRWSSGLFGRPRNELEQRERKKERRIKRHIRAKRREARYQRIKEWMRHPLGMPKTELEKTEEAKNRAINRHLNRKIRTIRIQQMKQGVSDSIAAIREPEIRTKLFKIMIPSLAGFVMAYLTTYILTNVSEALVSSFYGISTTVTNSVIGFNVPPNSPLWNKESVVVIFFTPVLMSMAISFFCLWLFSRSGRQGFMTKIYLFWMILMGQAMSWGSFFGGFIRKQGVYHALAWGFHQTFVSPKVMEIVFMSIAFIWLLVFGAVIKPLFIRVTPSVTLIRQKYRFAYYHFLISIPYFFGIATIAGINAPIFNLYIFIQLGSMILIFFRLYFEKDSTSPEIYRFKVTKSKLNTKVAFVLFILTVLIFKLIFDDGINF